MSILDRIDNTIAGDCCPCGAAPRPGSPYCSPDCEPTWRGEDTISDIDGTAMRWRPGLVTAHDDSGLRLVREQQRDTFRAVILRDDSPYADRTGMQLHLRLDDGHRLAGCSATVTGPDADAELEPVWQRLERELTDQRRLEPARLQDEMHLWWAGGEPNWPPRVGDRVSAGMFTAEAIRRQYLLSPVIVPATHIISINSA